MHRILIVDNEPELLDLLAFDLTQAGMEVARAESGQAALNSSAGRDASYTLPELLDRLSAPFERLFYGDEVNMSYEITLGEEPVFAVESDAIQQAQVFLYFTN